MTALYNIGWFILLAVSIFTIYMTVGIAALVRMFPEGGRWWQMPLQMLALAIFATVVLAHPFKA